MAETTVRKATRLQGNPAIPGDKSISHRGLIFGALATGTTEVFDILESEDVRSTAGCLRSLGVKITTEGRRTLIEGVGGKFSAPTGELDCGNSGTTMRLMMGVLAALPDFSATLIGDASLTKRPMKRVAEPLRRMGAEFRLSREDFAPLTVHGARLSAVDYAMSIASAQIKTAVTLAALSASGTTRITGEIHSRDHTERLLRHFGVEITATPEAIEIAGGQTLRANRLQVPGDPSTAAFWLGAACLVPNAAITMERISLNPTRTGFLKALQRMGASIEVEITEENPEPVGRMTVRPGRLRGIHIRAEEVPSLIDELPLLAVLATQAEGRTLVEGAEELRVKESDRIEAVAKNLRAMGVRIEVRPDGFIIEGPQKLSGTAIETFHDHRIAMAFSIAGLVANGETRILGSECVAVSYPKFFQTLAELTA